MSQETKFCRYCETEKPIQDFKLCKKKKKKNDGYIIYRYSKCRECEGKARRTPEARAYMAAYMRHRMEHCRDKVNTQARHRRAANPKKYRQKDREKYNRNRARIREQARIRYMGNPEKHRNQVKAWVAKNPEKRKAYMAEYRKQKREYLLAWQRQHNEKRREQMRDRMRQKRAAMTPLEKRLEYDKQKANGNAHLRDTRYRLRNRIKLVEKERIRCQAKAATRIERIEPATIIERDGSACYLCHKELSEYEITLDHVIPLCRGGTHTADNLKVACRSCNSRKGRKLLSELDLSIFY
jgi:5-methylcytosine-specific restriction endonuclease McrA